MEYTFVINQAPQGYLKTLGNFEKKSGFYICKFELCDPVEEQKLKRVCRSLYQAGIAIGLRLSDFRPAAFFLDMDGTLICEESAVVFAHLNGCQDELKKIIHESMSGRCSFREAYLSAIKKLSGLSSSNLEKVVDRLTLQPGVNDFIKKCKEKMIPIFLISGGFAPIAKVMSERLGFKDWCASDLDIVDNYITGFPGELIVDGPYKKKWMLETCKNYEIDLEATVAVGDGANDRWMLSSAGIGIGFQSKPVLFDTIDAFNGWGNHYFTTVFLDL